LSSTPIVQPREVDTDLLRSWRLPDPEQAADKDERGRVLIVGGCEQMPGAVVLAALGAMRAGAGKLCVITSARVASVVAQSLPEGRIIGLPENKDGGLILDHVNQVPSDVDALLVGPGMQDEHATIALTTQLLTHCLSAKVVLDALAMSVLNAVNVRASAPRESDIVITPHPGEMAHLTGRTKSSIQEDLLGVALAAATRWRVTVAMKSATTFIATPDARLWRHSGGSVGLATSGSGDVLAGIIAGLCARGADAAQATVWGVALHARSGECLAREKGPVGYLAREIPQHVPMLMHALATC